MVSLVSLIPLLLLSVIVAVLVTSIAGIDWISISVGSFDVLPSVSSPSSLTSETLFVFPGLEPVTVTLLTTFPVAESLSVIK